MRATDYKDSIFGRPTREPGNKYAFTYYAPRPLPRSIEFSSRVVEALSQADDAVGRLNGLSTFIAEPRMLIGPYQRREAIASTRIEGTQTSLERVLQAEIDESTSNADTHEVDNYLKASELAFKLINTLPITQRLLLQVHEVLLQGVRGEGRNPGEFRRSVVWVGAVGATPETAIYVPPLPQYLPELLTDWENFVNDDGQSLPPLIQAAMMHYQFETIHPFLDGNGRMGRLLINLILKERGRMDIPLLYVSHYFETRRRDYYDALQGVRQNGDLETWLLLFLSAVTSQARDAVKRAGKLVEIRERYRHDAAGVRSHLPELADLITAQPVVSTVSVSKALGVVQQTARILIKDGQKRGWLTPVKMRGKGGRQFWHATEILKVMDAPMDYVDGQAV